MTNKKFDEFWIRILGVSKELIQECKNQKVIVWVKGGIFEDSTLFEEALKEYEFLSLSTDNDNETVQKYRHMFSATQTSVKGFFEKCFVYASIFIFGKSLKAIDLCKEQTFDGNEFFLLHYSDDEGQLYSEVNFVKETVFKKVQEYLLQAV